MPGRDRTGPLGEGPLTGRGTGLCGESAGTGAGRYMRGSAPYGLGRGGRPGRGRGYGRGYRARYWMQGEPGWRPEPDAGLLELDQSEETRLLKAEAEHMRSALEAIERRLEQLETT